MGCGAAIASEHYLYITTVCRRLQIDHQPMESTKGESYLNWMETHFNVQRRLYDYQFSLSTTPLEFEQAHQTFMELYNTTAHQGLLKDRCDPPIPLVVLGEAKGRLYTPDELTRKFSRALFPRTTTPYGCVTLHRDVMEVMAGFASCRPAWPTRSWKTGWHLGLCHCHRWRYTGSPSSWASGSSPGCCRSS